MKRIVSFLKNEADMYRRYPVKILIDVGILAGFSMFIWVVFNAPQLIAK